MLQYLSANLGEQETSDLAKLVILSNHKSFGMTILFLATIRLAWRIKNQAPVLAGPIRPSTRMIARSTHALLYFFLFSLPISGWLMSSASAYSVSWFNLFTFPDLVPANEDLKQQIKTVHELLASALFCLATIHLLAALKHYWLDKDEVMQRISGLLPITLSILICLAGVYLLFQPPTKTTTGTAEKEGGVSESQMAIQESKLPKWAVLAEESHIKFKAEQAGAEFEGSIDQWTPAIQFDASLLEESSVKVVFHINSIETDDNERDQMLQDPDWFNAQDPVFRADKFSIDSDTFKASNATLEIKGVRYAIPFTFSLRQEKNRIYLEGHSRLDRTTLKIGSGEWADTTWVGQHIEVEVSVVAKI